MMFIVSTKLCLYSYSNLMVFLSAEIFLLLLILMRRGCLPNFSFFDFGDIEYKQKFLWLFWSRLLQECYGSTCYRRFLRLNVGMYTILWYSYQVWLVLLDSYNSTVCTNLHKAWYKRFLYHFPRTRLSSFYKSQTAGTKSTARLRK